MGQNSKREKLPGELERKKLNGGGELVLAKSGNRRDRDYYQISFLFEDSKTNLLNDPFGYDPVEVERAYYDIKTAGDFWEQKDNLTIGYDRDDHEEDMFDDFINLED
jgi:hypothetical protein